MTSRETGSGGPDLGALLRAFRLRQGWTQEELSERLLATVSVATIGNIERGKSRPYKHTLEALATALGLTAEERAAVHEARQLAHRPTAASLTTAHEPRTPSTAGPTTAERVGPPREDSGDLGPLHRGVGAQASSSPALAQHLGPPVSLTPLIGRVEDVADIDRRVRSHPGRLVTLLGPGGTGKTRLAMAVAAGLTDAFPDGVCWVDLAPVRDPAQVLPAVARALTLRDVDGHNAAGRLTTHLRDAQLLIILDNMEQVVAATRDVVALLASCPGLRMLVTSRVALRVTGEQRRPVAPLELPAPCDALDTLAQVPAVELFVQRASAVDPYFVLDDANAQDIAALCVRLDGLPLALELAAARLSLLTPAQLLDRLQRQLEVLVDGPRDLPSRQQTIRATVAWSVGLLEPEQALVLGQLGVFAGGCAVSDAEAVCAVPGAPPGRVTQDIAALAEHSLIRLQRTSSGTTRVLLLDAVREYALEQLSSAGGETAVRTRHAQHFLQVVTAAVADLHGPRQAAAMTRLEEEADNIKAAQTWCLRDSLALEGLRLASLLVEPAWRQGGLLAGRAALGAALELARSTGSAAAASELEATALSGLGVLAGFAGDRREAAAWLEQSVAMWRTLGDGPAVKAGLSAALRDLGRMGGELEANPEWALQLWLEAAELARGLDDGWALARINTYEAVFVCIPAGNLDRARALLEQSVAYMRNAGDVLRTAIDLINLGEVDRAAGRRDDARAHLLACLELFLELRDPWYTGVVMHNLGYVALHDGELGRAAELFHDSRALHHRIGNQRGVAECMVGSAAVAAASGEYETARHLLTDADSLLHRLGASLDHTDQAEYDATVAALTASSVAR